MLEKRALLNVAVAESLSSPTEGDGTYQAECLMRPRRTNTPRDFQHLALDEMLTGLGTPSAKTPLPNFGTLLRQSFGIPKRRDHPEAAVRHT